jgi:hypothetical protein
MSSGNSDSYDHATKTEANLAGAVQLERLRTAVDTQMTELSHLSLLSIAASPIQHR